MAKITDRGPFGTLFRTHRIKEQDEPIDLAERFGISKESIYAWERGENFPAAKHQAAVAEYLGLEIGELMRMIDEWRARRSSASSGEAQETGVPA